MVKFSMNLVEVLMGLVGYLTVEVLMDLVEVLMDLVDLFDGGSLSAIAGGRGAASSGHTLKNKQEIIINSTK